MVTKSKNLPESTKQITMYFKQELLDRINKYWHKNELPDRSKAIKELIEIGLKSKGL